MKKILGLALLVILVGAGCTTNAPLTPEPPTTPSTPSNVDVVPTTTIPEPPVTTTSTTTTTPPTTTSTPPTTSKTYSMDEVKAHNTPDKCWTTIRSKVYDLTAWIAKHPGGDKAIMQLCGIDGTSKFVNKHGGMPQMEKALTGLEIGTLKK